MTIIDAVQQAFAAQKLIESSFANTTFHRVQEFARQIEESRGLVANAMKEMAAPMLAAEKYALELQHQHQEIIAALESRYVRPEPFLSIEPVEPRVYQNFDFLGDVAPEPVDDTPEYSSTSRPALRRGIGFLYSHEDDD